MDYNNNNYPYICSDYEDCKLINLMNYSFLNLNVNFIILYQLSAAHTVIVQ